MTTILGTETTTIPAELVIVDAATFADRFNAARDESDQIREATSPLDVDRDETDTIFRLSVDGRSGYAVRADGELVYVFSLERGRGRDMIRRAISDGAVYLDCFDGYLPGFYAGSGFRADCHVPNWTPGGPDVVYMSLPGYGHRHGMPVLP